MPWIPGATFAPRRRRLLLLLTTATTATTAATAAAPATPTATAAAATATTRLLLLLLLPLLLLGLVHHVYLRLKAQRSEQSSMGLHGAASINSVDGLGLNDVKGFLIQGLLKRM